MIPVPIKIFENEAALLFFPSKSENKSPMNVIKWYGSQ